jgi:Protein of unknown function (DUF429)
LIHVIGVDFTSAPTTRKPITLANANLSFGIASGGRELAIDNVERLETFSAFEDALNRSGPWVGGFDFPFGLPRELINTLAWPTQWDELVSHVETIGKTAFKLALDGVRESRPMGARYIPRRGDLLAGSSSPMKLVNPPVGLMFFEGAPRLLRAGVSVVPCLPSNDLRVALEAYPGYLARSLTKNSYKKDGRDGMTAERIAARRFIVDRLINSYDTSYATNSGFASIKINSDLQRQCIQDGSGDTLDAILCAVQAARAAAAHVVGDRNYGIPTHADPLEGWIATVV